MDRDITEAEEALEETDIDTALELSGFGRYQWGLFLLAGVCTLAYGYQMNLSSYLIPVVWCEFKLSSSQKGYITAAFALGGLLGLIPWGILADRYGRKLIIIISLVADTSVSYSSIFANSFLTLAIARFLNGFAITGSGIIVGVYCSEFTTLKFQRASASAFCIFINIAPIFLSFIGTFISEERNDVFFDSWRFFMLISTSLAFLGALIFVTLLPESPKFLMNKKRDYEALQVVKSIHEVNKDKNEFKVVKLVEKLQDSNEMEKESFSKNFEACLKPPYLSKIFLSSALMFFIISVNLGMITWLPEIFDRLEQYGKISNSTAPLCEVYRMIKTEEIVHKCQMRNSDPKVYFRTYALTTSVVVAVILNTFISHYVGLRTLGVIFSFLAAILVVVVYLIKDSFFFTLASCALNACSTMATIAHITSNFYLFPPKIRGFIVSIAALTGRLGAVLSNLLFGYFLDSYCEVPIFATVGCAAAAGILSFLLPNKNSESWKPR